LGGKGKGNLGPYFCAKAGKQAHADRPTGRRRERKSRTGAQTGGKNKRVRVGAIIAPGRQCMISGVRKKCRRKGKKPGKNNHQKKGNKKEKILTPSGTPRYTENGGKGHPKQKRDNTRIQNGAPFQEKRRA